MLHLSVLKAWILSVMIFLVPNAPWKDTFESTAEAFAENAIASPLFKDDDGRKTASVMISLAWFEGSLKPNAEGDHDCLKRDPRTKKCTQIDLTRPHSFCTFQINDSNFGTLGVTKDQLLTDIKVCTATALRMMKKSFTICSGRSVEDLLNWYAVGTNTCPLTVEQDKGRHRMRKGLWIFTHKPLLDEHRAQAPVVTTFLTDAP